MFEPYVQDLGGLSKGPYLQLLKALQGQDSPSSTIPVFSTIIVFHWKTPSQGIRLLSFNVGESRPRFFFRKLQYQILEYV